MQFREIVGQQELKHQFVQMALGKRMPHAQLFIGPKGSGKLPLALAFAQLLLCQAPDNDDSCGKCPSCVKVSKLVHPDLHLTFPTVTTKSTKPKSDDFIAEFREAFLKTPYMDSNDWLAFIHASEKQGNITEAECNNIIRKFSLKTYEGEYKILILWQAELLKKEGNRLLKLIEEPPEQSIFILIAEDQEAILNTILSRCQITRIKALSDEEVKAAVSNRFNLDGPTLDSLTYMANGDLHEAYHLAEKGEVDHASRFLEWFRSCYKGHGPDLVDWVAKTAKIGREKQKQFLRYGLHFLQEFLQIKMESPVPPRLGTQEYTTAQKMCSVLEFEQVCAMMDLFNELHFHVERNANPKVLFLDASIRVHHIFNNEFPVSTG